MTQPDELKKDEPLLWSPGHGTDVWAMFCACVSGDLPAVQQLLARDPSLARCNYHYRTPLYFAVRENRLPIVDYLLSQGGDPLSLAVDDSLLQITIDRGYSELQQFLERRLAKDFNASPKGEPLAAAIRARDFDQVRALLDSSPDLLHAGDERSNQPIHWATMTRQIPIIDFLLDRGADINAQRYDHARPIQLINGDYHYRGWRDVPKEITATPAEVLAHLRSRGAYVDICTASHIGDLDRVKELLRENPALANYASEYSTYYLGSGTPLRNAAARGHLRIVQLLLEHGADPNLPEEGIAPKGHALYSAVYNRQYEITKLLLEHGAYPSPPVESSADALSIAISNSDQPMIDLLCSCGSAQSIDLLVYYGDLKTTAAALAANPSLAQNLEAFAAAVGGGNENFVRLFLRYAPDLPKRLAGGSKNPVITELLFSLGMNPNYCDWLGDTPLHHFARNGDIQNTQIFLNHAADINARNEDLLSTPLAIAAKFGKTEMVEFLLHRGAKTNLPDDPPWATPLAWASRRNHPEILTLLQHHGASH